MKYDFTTLIDRHNTGSLKWDCKENELPMWVADMDFAVAPEIQKAIIRRAGHPIYGYTSPDDSWYNAYISFWKDEFGFTMKKEWLAFSEGVVPIISSSVRKFTKEGDNIVVLSPVYNIFYNTIINNHRQPLEVPLLRKGDDFFIDFDKLEKAFEDPRTTLIIFCNPHNPVGRIWTKDELAKLGEMASRNHVVVLSDEIHCPLTRPGTKYVPFASVNETNLNNCIMAVSPTKAFNLAGIQTSCLVVPNKELRKKAVRQINTDEVAEPNVFACPAAVAALNEGREWLKELNEVIFNNRDRLEEFAGKEIPEIEVLKGDATYLAWADIRKLTSDARDFCSFLREKTGLWIQSGEVYGQGGEGYVRINLACPRSRLEDGLARLKKGVDLYKAR